MENSKAIGILQAVKAGTADIFISKAAINDALDMAIAALEQQEKAFDEWCTDCKEYDHNRNCCPRYNRVIRGAVDEVKQQGWIPCSERLPEKAYGQYWVCTDTGSQCQCRWTDNVYGLGSSGEWAWKIFDIPQYSHVIAWMPLPEPYRAERRTDE